MKTRIFFGIMAMALLASCESVFEFDTTVETTESSELVFTAVTEGESATRTTLSNYTNDEGAYYLYWSSGDEISITDGVNTAVYTTNDSYSSSAEFVCTEGNVSRTATRYVAFYPSSITTANMVLPAVQNYVNKNVENFPMRAVSDDKELEFKNLCGILRFSMKTTIGDDLSVSSISLSAEQGLSGAFSVGADNAAVVTGTDGVVLRCAEPKNLYSSSAVEFNIVVPQGDYNPLKVKICDAEGNEVNLVSEGIVSVKRSQITNINLTLAKSTFGTSLETIPITSSDVEFSER